MGDKVMNIIDMQHQTKAIQIILKKEWFEHLTVRIATQGKLYAIIGFSTNDDTQPEIITYLNKLFMIYTVLAYDDTNVSYGNEINAINNKLQIFDKNFNLPKDFFIVNENNSNNINTDDLNTLIGNIKSIIDTLEPLYHGGRSTNLHNLTKQKKYRRTRSKSSKRNNKKSII